MNREDKQRAAYMRAGITKRKMAQDAETRAKLMAEGLAKRKKYQDAQKTISGARKK